MTSPHPDPELLALAALPAQPADPEVSAHLGVCSVCRTHVDELRHTVQLARDEVSAGPLPTPPPRVWRAVLDELALDEVPDDAPGSHRPAAPGTAPADPVLNGSSPGHPPAGQPARGVPRRIRLGAAVAAAAVTLLAGLGLGVAFGRSGTESPPQAAPVAQLSPIGFADPNARGSVAVLDRDGTRRLLVQLDGVTDLAGGDYLEAWLMDGTGTRLIALGPLTPQDGQYRGDFALPAGLPLGEFTQVDVSAERWDGNPGHSAVSLLRGELA
jgi:Anti-sigma-K factor rskA